MPGGAALHSSFNEDVVSALSTSVADMRARRSISDSVLCRSTSTQYNNQNTVFMMVSRSGGSTVKVLLAALRTSCDANDRGEDPVVPPEKECCILAQWAEDTYYSIVIAGNNGIPLIVRTMASFSSHRGLQECCCLALGNLCSAGGGNLKAVEEAGAIPKIILAMKTHSQSIAVQSAACDALRNMFGLVMMQTQQNPGDSTLADDLISTLSHAKDMHLLPKHRTLASDLLAIVLKICTRAI
jgi:hypothetical protein